MSLHSTSDIEKKEENPEFPVLSTTLTEGIANAARQHGHTEQRDGRWVLDPEEARLEYGDEVS
jgi:hypothetical protein